MHINKTVCWAALLFGCIALAQPIPVYKDTEDYCRQNPHAPTCRDGKPIDVMGDINRNWKKYQVPTEVTPAFPARVIAPQSQRVQRVRSSASPSVVQVGELDWRFAHPHPDLLIGMDLENLLGSELMRTLLRDWAGKLGARPRSRTRCWLVWVLRSGF